MSDMFLDDMRQKLFKLREDLQAMVDINDQSSQVVELDQSRVGRLSRMDAMQAQAMAQASGRRRALMLKRIQAALIRIDQDDYGICQSCDEPINRKRLEFDATALLCVQCANDAEK